MRQEQQAGMKVKIQRFGSYLSGMIMPNIGAFIAWGIITALFIPKGWFPNPRLNTLVSPMITYLLPLLIAYTGGKMIYDHRGGSRRSDGGHRSHCRSGHSDVLRGNDYGAFGRLSH